MVESIKKFKGTEVELEYLLTGEENSETIIFAHGAGSNLRQFLYQHEYFSIKYRVLSFSMRGHGDSQSPKDDRIEAFAMKKHARDIMELLEYLDIKKFHYVGNSAGGMLGYELIAKKPEWFLTIVTYGMAPELKLSKLMVKLVAGIDRMMININRKGYMNFLGKAVAKDKGVQEEIYSLFMAGDKDTAWKFRANIGNYSYLTIMKKIKVPALIIKGEGDKDVNKQINVVLEIIDRNPNFSVVDLKNAGHIANLDSPLEFNQIIEAHFKGANVNETNK